MSQQNLHAIPRQREFSHNLSGQALHGLKPAEDDALPRRRNFQTEPPPGGLTLLTAVNRRCIIAFTSPRPRAPDLIQGTTQQLRNFS